MLRADDLTVVHHDDTVSRFADVRYTLSRDGIRVRTAAGDELHIPAHEVLTIHVRRHAQRRAALIAQPAL